MAATVTLVAEKNLVRVPGVLALAAPELRGVAPPLLPAPLLLGRRPRREELRHGVVHLRGRGEERRGLPEVEVVGVLHRHLPRPLDADPGVERVHVDRLVRRCRRRHRLPLGGGGGGGGRVLRRAGREAGQQRRDLRPPQAALDLVAGADLFPGAPLALGQVGGHVQVRAQDGVPDRRVHRAAGLAAHGEAVRPRGPHALQGPLHFVAQRRHRRGRQQPAEQQVAVLLEAAPERPRGGGVPQAPRPHRRGRPRPGQVHGLVAGHGALQRPAQGAAAAATAARGGPGGALGGASGGLRPGAHHHLSCADLSKLISNVPSIL
mmetsp:Transcript_40110/g.69244  ORF Transcript_40110/g.69244 Transcript_40110/m.69244 type:complete len:320 (+) Transcript_40110:596-1555(+)